MWLVAAAAALQKELGWARHGVEVLARSAIAFPPLEVLAMVAAGSGEAWKVTLAGGEKRWQGGRGYCRARLTLAAALVALFVAALSTGRGFVGWVVGVNK
ncbi:hypothetical protein E1263_11435 [Kribbella antibiotica]|uniref:Uncharacterized protein n=1 Tax=Kribbella antibiotica TaxID=190195 RepID=A0A4R4ZNC4_9ACTN|nr:hypothetical protein [Kribbella antibiotica]TDD60381.1 hypothetical protein E1263_11435 [Kribbella antibiotica]